jgi:hypothetical protein
MLYLLHFGKKKVLEKKESIQGMGKIQEISDFVRESALKALRERLIQIGLTPTSISKTQTLFSGVIGAVSIVNRNIDLVKLERKISGGYSIDGEWSNAKSTYRCSYIIHAKVDGLEEKLKAHSKLPRKGIINRHYSKEPKWEGKELAEALNSDALTLLPNVQVLPNGSCQCVVMREKRYWDSWFSAFPTVDTFETFDRIAMHVRRIVRYASNTDQRVETE